MKRTILLFLLIGLASCFSLKGSTNVVATLAFTNVVNGVTNGDTITINGDQRNYTNGALADASIWIQSTNIVGWAATNTLFHLGAYKVANVYTLQFTNGTNIVIEGEVNKSLTVTLSAGIGTVSYVTNTFEDLRPLMTPMASLPTASGRTNQHNRLVEFMNESFATGKVLSAAIIFTNFANLYNAQTLSNKTTWGFTNQLGLLDSTRGTNLVGLHGTNNYLQGGVFDGQRITNAIAVAGTNHSLYGGTYTVPTLVNVVTLSGVIGIVTNGYWTNGVLDSPIMTNGANYGSAFRSPGTGGNSDQFGSGATATAENAFAAGTLSVASGVHSFAGGNGSLASGGASTAVGTGSGATDTNATAYGAASEANAPGSSAFGAFVVVAANHTNSMGLGASTTETNQIMLGASTHKVRLSGQLQVTGSMTNNYLTGSNRLAGSWSLTRRTEAGWPADHNVITNSAHDNLVWLTAPAGGSTNIGFTGGHDGRVIEYVKYNGGYIMGIANESGSASPGDRILTGTGADVNITNSPGFFKIRYDSILSRWVLLEHSD